MCERQRLGIEMRTKFNGLSKNYDGAARNASDDDTQYMLGWVNF